MDKKKRAAKKAQEIVKEYITGNDKTDPNGSWTGRPENPYEKPVQDADDL